MNDKSELLQQLKIDRSAESRAIGLRLWHLFAFGAVCVAVTVWISQSYLRPETVVQTANSQVSAAPSRPAPEAAAETPPVTSEDAGAQESDAILNSSGYITARRMATVSAEIMGLITEVRVEEGMSVSEGQILARLDDVLAQINADLALAQVKVLAARRTAIAADLAEAQRNHKRITENEYSSDADESGALARLQNLTAGLASADADILVAELEVKRQNERLADHVIRAPFAGVVTEKNAQPGEIVAPTSAGGGFTRTGICTIVDMQSLEIEVDVNESFIGRIFAGQIVEARLDAYPDWRIPASVIAIIPTADRAKATVQVRIKIETSDPRVLPDMGVKVAFMKS